MISRCPKQWNYEVGGASEHHAADALWWSFHEPEFGASWIYLVEDYLHLPLGIWGPGFQRRLKDPDGKNACVAPPTVLLGSFVGCFTCNMQLKNGDFQLQHHFSEAFSGFFRCHPVPPAVPHFFFHIRSSPGTHDQPVARLRRPGLLQWARVRCSWWGGRSQPQWHWPSSQCRGEIHPAPILKNVVSLMLTALVTLW